MSFVILVAPSPDSAAAAWARLRQADLPEAAPSRRENLTPQQVHELMLKTVFQRRNVQQAPSQAQEKIWTELATDLLMGNVDQAQFGWSQAIDEHTPVFWQRFEPETRFVLVYEEPTAFAARAIEQDHTKAQDLHLTLQHWHSRHSLLLNTFYALGADAVLVHASQLQCAAEFLGLQAKPEVFSSLPALPSSGAVRQLLKPLVAADDAVQSLWQELQAAASGPWQDLQPAMQAAEDALRELLRLQTARVEQAKAPHSDEPKNERNNELSEAQEENELLLAQLHQVQEELENYFLKYQEQRKRVNTLGDFWQQQPPAEIWMDMRRTPDGHGWYEAEADGRWSGPDTESTLHLPPLEAGPYWVELHIADAMAPELVANLQLTAQLETGQVLPIDLVHEFGPADGLYPMVSTGLLNLPATQSGWRLCLALPEVISPAAQGGDDTRHLGLRLQGVRLSLQEADPSRMAPEAAA
jgi:hypothetical protein